MKYLIIGFLATLFFACSPKATTSSALNTLTFWVDGMKVPCTGAGPQSCLRVKKGEDFNSAEWELLYSGIEGFDYETGYVYQLKVSETRLPPAQVPADASSIKYTLVEIVDKRPDPKTRLHDIWALEAINGEDVDFDNAQAPAQRPTLEINLTEQRVFGTDGCNDFSGSLTSVTDTELRMGALAATRKACIRPVVPGLVNAAMQEVTGYELDGLKLSLTNDAGREVLRYRKVD
ncbi:DUF4377 domain-containing protein [Neolewinella aurantiaca]|uniref:DUF4377 domain-containing protein n=1 Tax=Neolewinella aurantiaca TaxID=2602767 RepID=A0A5C7FUT2_9BACT|nr:DUF4377 domain-containing protein [Neolewinella aurantiaca]TXF90087.1 DUF4377 domain-containing protein [Neolewinella aurantiaca]